MARSTTKYRASVADIKKNVPAELRARDRWLLWNHKLIGGEWKKVPYCVASPTQTASVTDSSTWASFDEAIDALPYAGCSGLGYVLGAGIVGLDLDHCIEDGEISSEARELLASLPTTYAELSQSKTGVHAFYLGNIKRSVRTKGVEIYGGDRYFVVTGWSVPDLSVPTIAPAGDDLNALVARLSATTTKGSTIEYTGGTLPERIPVGERDNVLFSWLCRWRAKNYAADDARALLGVLLSRCEQRPGDVFTETAADKLFAHVWNRYPPGAPPSTTTTTGALPFYTAAELVARVAAAGPRRFLLRGIWPEGDYGVLAAEPKAHKTFAMVDAIVSVASGTPWLGKFAVDHPGPALIFCGEGGEANITRRMVATAEARGLNFADLPITISPRAPHLGDQEHLRAMREKLDKVRPVLVGIDPLYLAARGANMADLYSMGAFLEAPQLMCAEVGAALWVSTHYNRRDAKGVARFLGSGPAEWGRVLIGADLISKRTDKATQMTDTLVELNIIGGEIADQSLRVRRKVWTDNPDDLNSPMHLEVEVQDVEVVDTGATIRLPPAAQKLLEALKQGPADQDKLVDRIVQKHGHGLRHETVSRSLTSLKKLRLAIDDDPGTFKPKTWTYVDPPA